MLMALVLTVPASAAESAGPTPPGCWDFELDAFGSGDGHGDGLFTEWSDDGFAYATFTNGVREFEFYDVGWTGTLLERRPHHELVYETFDVGPFSFAIETRLAISVSSREYQIWSTNGTAQIVSGGTGTAAHTGAFDAWGVRYTSLEGTICY